MTVRLVDVTSPAGERFDDGETPASAAARETAEETVWRVEGEAEHLFSSDPLPGQVRVPVLSSLERTSESRL